MTATEVVSLVQAVIWPVFVLSLVVVFRGSLTKLLTAIEKRLDSGAEVTSAWLTFGAAPSILKSPEGDAAVTGNHVALVHSSWRYPKKDAEFQRPMYALTFPGTFGHPRSREMREDVRHAETKTTEVHA